MNRVRCEQSLNWFITCRRWPQLQCTDSMQGKCDSTNEWETENMNSNENKRQAQAETTCTFHASTIGQ